MLNVGFFVGGHHEKPVEESDGAKRVMNLLDDQLGERFGTVSAVVVKKYGYGYYCRASRVVGDWYGAGHRLSRPALRSLSSLSISSSSPTSSLLTMSSSRRSVAWSSPGSSVKAEEEEEDLDDALDKGTPGLQSSPSLPQRMKQTQLSLAPLAVTKMPMI